MVFFEAYLIFNIWSMPIDRATLPTVWNHYYAGSPPDTVQTYQARYDFLNDSLIRNTVRDSSISTNKITLTISYWGLDKSGHIAFVSTSPNRGDSAKTFIEFIYENGLLVREIQRDNGQEVLHQRLEYVNGNETRTVITDLVKNDSVQIEYTWADGKISERREDFGGGSTYKTTYAYTDGKVSQSDRVPTGSGSTAGKSIYFYESGKLAKFEDYEAGKMLGLALFKYPATTGLLRKKTDASLKSPSAEVDGLGRIIGNSRIKAAPPSARWNRISGIRRKA